MELSTVLPKILAWSYFFVGISILFHRAFWAEMLIEISYTKSVLIAFGFFFLPLGLLIVMVHNVWVWSPVVMITIIGWALILKSVIWLLCPNLMQRLIPSKAFIEKWIVIDGGLFVGLTAWLLFHLYTVA